VICHYFHFCGLGCSYNWTYAENQNIPGAHKFSSDGDTSLDYCKDSCAKHPLCNRIVYSPSCWLSGPWSSGPLYHNWSDEVKGSYSINIHHCSGSRLAARCTQLRFDFGLVKDTDATALQSILCHFVRQLYSAIQRKTTKYSHVYSGARLILYTSARRVVKL
jgi:hypothetical protein